MDAVAAARGRRNGNCIVGFVGAGRRVVFLIYIPWTREGLAEQLQPGLYDDVNSSGMWICTSQS